MKVVDVMQKDVVSVDPSLPLAQLEEVLTGDEISGVPVLDANTGRVVGVVTKTDVVRFWSENYADELRARLGEDVRVEELMTPNLVTARPDEDVRAVARRMLEHGVHRILVLEGDEMHGIVTSLDLLRALV